MQTVLLILGLIGAMLAMQGIFLLAHHLQRQMGTMALGAVTGASIFGIWIFARIVPELHITPDFSFSILSMVVYANLIALLLVVYVCDGTKYTRRLLVLLFAIYALTIGLQEVMAFARQLDAVTNRYPLSDELFSRNWRITIAAVAALLVSFIMVISGYQLLTNYMPRLPRGLRVGLVLTIVLLVDGLLYTMLGFAGQPFYAEAMRNQVIAKFFAALVLTPSAAWYITRTLASQAAQEAEFRPIFDVVGGVTEMGRELETILATMVDGMILFSTEGKITRANAAAERLLGRTLSGLRLDDPLLRMVYSDGSRIPYGDSPMLQMLRMRRPIENVELGIRQSDGSLRILSINASPLLDARQRMLGGLATFRDITQRKQVDEYLASSQEFLRSLIEETPLGVIVFDQEGAAEHVNKAFLKILGLESPNELIGRFNAFTDPLFAKNDLVKYCVQAYKGKIIEISPTAIDFQNKKVFSLDDISFVENAAKRTADGLKVVSLLLFPVRDRNGKVRSVVAMVTDLTERTRAERSRKEIEARFQDMVARIADYLFSARVEHGSLKYEFCSPVIEKITGYPEEFFLNDNWFWFKIILLDDQQRVQEELLNLFTQREDEGVIEYRIRARHGDTRWLQSRFTVLRNDKGKIERVIGAVSDISRQKEAEEAVRKAVGKFRSLVETMHELVVTIDGQGKISFANRSFYRVMNYSDRAVLGKNIHDYVHPEQVDAVKGVFQNVMRGEHSLRNYELRFRKANGEYLLLIMNADPLYEESGAINGILTVAFDITERRQAIEAIQKRNAELMFMNQLSDQFKSTVGQEELFQLVYEFLPVAMGIQHTDIALWNERRQMLLHQNGAAGGEGAHNQFGVRVSQRCFDSGEPVVINDSAASALVEPEWIERAGVQSTAAVPILEAGRTIGVLRVDDTREKNRFTEENIRYLRVIAQQLSAAIQNTRLYQKLRSSEENYRSLFENAADGIYRATIDGHLLAANPALVKMLDYQTAGDVLALHMPEHLFMRREDFEALKNLLRSRKFVHGFETMFKRRDGSVIDVRINAHLVTETQHAVEQVEGDVDDITEEKVLREHLLQAQKLEGLGRMSGGLAHDFNNYLNAIINNLTLAREYLPPETPAAKYLRDAELAADQGADLIYKLLTFSRSSADADSYLAALRSAEEVVRVDVNASIAEAIEPLRQSLERDVTLVFEPSDTVVNVNAEPLQIKQLIMNLGVNARDAVASNAEAKNGQSKITISTSLVEIDEAYRQKYAQARTGRFVRLAVTDTGAGIAANVQQRMFEPFFTTKEPGKGTGLGLAVVYGLVQQLHGWITYNTKVGEGTTFEVYLPAAN
ncbi:PAS domain S-box protein [bacterium]|nr:PAS domain S-box protein [bacterium]